jgi:hypothetical protein
VRPVICREFVKDVLDTAFDGFFRNIKLRSDFFVGIS